MIEPRTNPLHQALFRILRPLARLLLRNGIPFGEFSELVKRAYVEAALKDFSGDRRKATDSAAAVMTGLTRKEVKRQREILAGRHTATFEVLHTNRASRVVSGWVNDAQFKDATGEPAELPFEGPVSFCQLAKKYSGDMPPRAVLDELLRVNLVSVHEDTGELSLNQRAYVPAGDSQKMLQIFGEDVSDLIATMDHNLACGKSGQQPLFQRTLTYNNISSEVMDAWRMHAAEQSQKMLEQLDSWLGPKDRDVSGESVAGSSSESIRTGVSVFYFEDPQCKETRLLSSRQENAS
ncbi:DUF6502 family protein [Marinobacter salexigens]|uniref:Uncharacterized protein n=1 Tax=Marinobacter salexigens TaxID=1925763 RepID=A0ABS6A693_9GAMM|nr:DUF6502 family protein [Marinobacter salexigens]MBU2873511.1 hypothetical protein [Marinobacter salexigens]